MLDKRNHGEALMADVVKKSDIEMKKSPAVACGALP
jgi:hypothetical protein